MNALAEFMRARMDEDAAEAAWLKEDWWLDVDRTETAEAVRRFADADRVLRAVEAKRQLLAEHAPADFTAYGDELCRRCVWQDDEQRRDELHPWVVFPCRTVRLLAAEWDTHPDFQKGWANGITPEEGD